ncbi:putative membrane protein SirB2 [Cytobacillus purgationiresistens]|uniref:Membrane protein SirB2 n=2 Tax=Cytobacillus purgationiresistens TaxID=863449 RepID=A0ABU0AJN2_9BACI|nr:putative membrane protein SirB2 [Cytobacillus purgationiresistens]
MIAIIVIELFIALLFIIMGWIVRFKKVYGLISGFNNRPEEEQKQLIENGYPQKTGSLLLITGIGMIVLLPLNLASFTYATEMVFGFMLILLLGGMIYISKFEVSHKRKRSYLVSSILFFVIVGGIAAITLFSYQGYSLVVKDDSFEVTGMYGKEWNYDSITEIELLEELPETTWKENGVGLPTLSKGHFKVEGYGSSLLLFIQHHSPPYIYIQAGDKPIFINDKDPTVTKKWFSQIEEKIKKGSE